MVMAIFIGSSKSPPNVLIIESKFNRGLLLPQVPVEQKWDIEEFLENLCYKAGLDSDAWKDDDTTIYNFQAQVFQENN